MIRVAAAAIVMLLGACAGTAAGSGGQPAAEARVGLVEWDITTSAPVLAEGGVLLRVTNAGATAHDLRVSGAGVEAATPLLSPGDDAVLSLQVDAGDELLLWCGVPGHREQGMQHRLRVENSR